MAELGEPTVLLAHSPRSWMQEVHFFVVDHGGALVAGYALSAEDAVASHADVFIIDDTCSFLSRRLVDDLHSVGTALIGVFEPREGAAGLERLLRLGVDEILPSHAPAEEFLSAVGDLARASAPSGPPEEHHFNEPSDGKLIAVTAAAAGAGATEVAIAVASRMRSRSRAVALVDADERTPSVAQRLGLGLQPNLATAIEAMLHGSGKVDDSVTPSAGLAVLCGLPNPQRGHDARPEDVVGVVGELSRRYPIVVANICACPGAVPGTLGSERGAVARLIMERADSIVLVGSASPVGLTRIAAWLGASQSVATGKKLHVVLNRFPGGGYRSGEIVDELQRFAGPRSVTVIPADRRVQHAEWKGMPVRRGPFRRAATQVAAQLEASVPL